MSAKKGQRNTLSLEDYAAGIARGERATLARAITLIESSNPDHQALAQELLQRLVASTGEAIRVGITGAPGVGKSTLIDQLGTNLTASGHKVAVLAVDPTSERSGGSILGDKTRMPRLAQDDNAFIRPSPTSGTLGGVTKTTRETMALCEAAGFDVLLIETVGVGQSETAVAGMVDFFLALMLPGAGDELQGIKKGVIEIADMIAVTKADCDNVQRAELAASEYRAALQILKPVSPNWLPPVITVSAKENSGIPELWELIERHQAKFAKSGELEAKRQDQAVRWMHDMLEARLRARLRADKAVSRRISELEQQVRLGQVAPTPAVEEILKMTGLSPATEKSA